MHNTTIYGVNGMWKNRTKSLIGEGGISKLSKSRVAVIGIGGVGGHACLMLARAGVENLAIVDFDVVDVANINRQAVATTKTVGQKKTEVMKRMLEEINPNCEIQVFDERINKQTIEQFFENNKFDMVVDAIDSIEDKVELICYCKEKNIKIVSAMGAGNRSGIPHFEVLDIYKTENDGLAKVMRKKLRERNISHLTVVSTKAAVVKFDNNSGEKIVGSISYYPAMCGCVLSAYVIDELLKSEN